MLGSTLRGICSIMGITCVSSLVAPILRKTPSRRTTSGILDLSLLWKGRMLRILNPNSMIFGILLFAIVIIARSMLSYIRIAVKSTKRLIV